MSLLIAQVSTLRSAVHPLHFISRRLFQILQLLRTTCLGASPSLELAFRCFNISEGALSRTLCPLRAVPFV